MAQNLAFNAPSNVAVHPATARLDAAEAAHLRSLIEKQPSCLMRIAEDGTLLAISDAALSLLGARDLADALDTSFVDRLPDEPGVWPEFVRRVSNGRSASAECEMTDLTGARRSVMLLGVALRDHPDGTPSLLVSARDISAARRLEASLQEQDGLRQSVEELTAKLAMALADRQQLELAAADSNQLRASLEHLSAERQQLRARLGEAADERRQLLASLADATTRCDEIQAELAAATVHRDQLDAANADRQRLRAALDEAKAGREELRSALNAATIEMQHLEAAGADRQRLRAALDEAIAGRQQIARSLEQMVAEREELETASRERETKRQRTLAEHVTGRMKAERALAEARAQLEQLTSALATVIDLASATRLILGNEAQK